MLTVFRESSLAVCRLDEELFIYYHYLLRILGFSALLGFQISNSPKLSEAVTRSVLLKKDFLKILKYSQENICVVVAF